MSRLTQLVILLALFTSTGCVRVALAPGVVIAEEQIEKRRVEKASRQVRVVVDQEGTTLSVLAARRCNIEERAQVRQTLEQDRINTSPGITWQLGIYGTILAAVGAGVIIDAQLNVADSDLDGRDYNAIGPVGASFIGGAFLAAATPLLLIAVVDGIRATGSEEHEAEAEISRGIVSRDVACKREIPAASATVLGRTRKGTEVNLGNTDARGQLEIDLVAAVEAKITLGERATNLALFIEGHAVGQADLKPVAAVHRTQAREHEEGEWAKLDPDACATDGTPASCQPLEKFLQKYPRSRHAPAARVALAKGKAAQQQGQDAAKRRRDQAAAEAARAAAERRRKEAAARQCRNGCAAGCKGNAKCVQACVAAKCQ